MDSFRKLIESGALCLTDGAINERVNRREDLEVDEELAQTSLLYSEEGIKALSEIYSGYFSVAAEFDIPMLTLAPTWKANRLRLERKSGRFRDGNTRGVEFIRELRERFSTARIYVGGDLGCKGDAYDPRDALEENEAADFHSLQCQELASAGADFLIATALPALSEALGLARAMGATDTPYILSFVVRPNGQLLDGESLEASVRVIDGSVSPRPIGYLVNCVHPSTMLSAFSPLPIEVRSRILGLKANTSSRTPEELNNLNYLDTIEPADFGKIAASACRELKLQCIGGCCGTDDRHIRALAEELVK